MKRKEQPYMTYLALRDELQQSWKLIERRISTGAELLSIFTGPKCLTYGKAILRVGDGIPAMGVLPRDYFIESISESFTD